MSRRAATCAVGLLSCLLTGCGFTIEPWQKPIETLIERLRDENQVVRAEAASNLGDHASEAELDPEEAHAAVTALRLALRDPFEEVRLRAAIGLKGLGPRASTAVSDLARTATEDPNRRVRALAWNALAGIGPDALPVLSSAVEAGEEGVRVAALGALEQSVEDDAAHLSQTVNTIPNPTHTLAVIRVVTRSLEDRSARVRALAVEVLGRRFSPWPEAIGPALTRALGDDDERIAALAARYLGALDRLPREAPAALYLLLHPPRELGRGLHRLFSLGQETPVAAAVALVRHGFAPERALRPLLSAAADRDAPDRLDAIRALRIFNGRAAPVTGALAVLLDTTPDPALRHAAVRTLESIGPPAHRAAAALRRVAHGDRDQRLRVAARRALTRLRR